MDTKPFGGSGETGWTARTVGKSGEYVISATTALPPCTATVTTNASDYPDLWAWNGFTVGKSSDKTRPTT